MFQAHVHLCECRSSTDIGASPHANVASRQPSPTYFAASLHPRHPAHCSCPRPPGTIGTRPGTMMAASDRFSLRVLGVGGHGALPHTARDPVVAAAAVVMALQAIVSRETSPVDAAVITVSRWAGTWRVACWPPRCHVGRNGLRNVYLRRGCIVRTNFTSPIGRTGRWASLDQPHGCIAHDSLLLGTLPRYCECNTAAPSTISCTFRHLPAASTQARAPPTSSPTAWSCRAPYGR